jgi:lysophospholipase-3
MLQVTLFREFDDKNVFRMKSVVHAVIITTVWLEICTAATRTPIVIIPGFSGSQLQGTVNRGLCVSDKPRLLWVDVKNLNCSIDLELEYDASTNRYSDKEGVSVAVPGFGETYSVECLANNTALCRNYTPTGVQYFNIFVYYFVNKGYQRGVDIRAAPYDWRLAPDSLNRRGYYKKLRKLIEDMYKTSGRPVAMVAHSQGGPHSLYFLNQVVSKSWKNKYIKAYISLSGAFSGSSGSLESVASGALPSVFVTRLLLQRSFESLYWSMPKPSVFKDQALIETPSGNFTASDYEMIFTKLAKYPLGWTKYKPTASISTDFSFPGVPTYCFVGSDVPTPLMYKFKSDDLSEQPIVVNGEGDGTVNKVSLDVCLRWSSSSIFHYRPFSGVTHGQMVRNESVLEAVANVVL